MPQMTMTERLKNGARSIADWQLWLHSFRILHYYGYSHVREKRKMTIGASPVFAPNASIRNGERITLGDRVHIGERFRPEVLGADLMEVYESALAFAGADVRAVQAVAAG